MSTAHDFAGIASDADLHAMVTLGNPLAESPARAALVITPAGMLRWAARQPDEAVTSTASSTQAACGVFALAGEVYQ